MAFFNKCSALYFFYSIITQWNFERSVTVREVPLIRKINISTEAEELVSSIMHFLYDLVKASVFPISRLSQKIIKSELKFPEMIMISASESFI